MKTSRKYVIAVVLLAVFAVTFGLAGVVMPVSETGSPQQSSSSPSDSFTHFMNPPTFDSGWVNIQDKRGLAFNVTHDLNASVIPAEAQSVVDITGKIQIDGGPHQINLGCANLLQGWNTTYGRRMDDVCNAMIQTRDRGYALAGSTRSFGEDADGWLIKTNGIGNEMWNQTYEGVNYDRFSSLVQTSDGGYAMAGYTYPYPIPYADCWLVKTDGFGSLQWNYTYADPLEHEQALSVIQTNDGGYAMAGYSVDFDHPFSDFLLVKTDVNGTQLWARTYDNTDGDVAYCVIQTNDGGYALAGTDGNDFWLVKTDNNGNHQWDCHYGGLLYDAAYSIVETCDGGYVLLGNTQSFGAGGMDLWLVKTDSMGNMRWNQTYGGSGSEGATSVVEGSDRGYLLVGLTRSFGAGDADFWLVKTDYYGNHQWNHTYGGIYYDVAVSVAEASEGGYVLAGTTNSSGAGNYDFWLVKTCADSGLPGLTWIDSKPNELILYRGSSDSYWNYVRVRIWLIKEPTWIYGDINMDGIVDAADLYIVSRNYGKTFSLLSLGGIIAVAGIHQYNTKRKLREAKK